MIRIPCPTIYCDGSAEYTEQQDSQGVDGWAQSYTYWEPSGSDCDHEYNEEQTRWLDAQLDIAAANYVPDYSWMDP